MKSLDMTCPLCDNQLQVPENIARLSCAHCGKALAVRQGDGFVTLVPVLQAVPSTPSPKPSMSGKPSSTQTTSNRGSKRRRNFILAAVGGVLLVCCGIMFSITSSGDDNVTQTPRSKEVTELVDGNTPTGDITSEDQSLGEGSPIPIRTTTPKPSATSTKIPTNTPTATPSILITVLQTANLRAGPGSDFEIVGSAEQGEELRVIGRNNDGSWLQVDRDGSVWIWVQLIESEDDLNAIPVPPTATSTNTPPPSPTIKPSPTKTPIPTPSQTPIPVDAGASEWLEYEGLKVGVREIAWNYTLGYYRPEAEHIYISLYIVAINNSDSEQSFYRGDFGLVDGGGEISGHVIFGDKSPEFSSCTVKPGGECEGWWTTMIWDKPEVKEDLTLRWDPGFFSPTLETEIFQEPQ